MNILAFDTALAACSAGVWRDGELIAHKHSLMDRGQAEHLVPIIATVMERAEIGFEQLDRIAVTVGPGSFTGVRVGLATARGLAIARAIPVIGLTTGEVLAAMARAHAPNASIVSLIDSKRGDLYVEAFAADGNAVGVALSVPAAEVSQWLVDHDFGDAVLLGDGVVHITVPAAARVLKDVVFPAPAVMATLAATKTLTGTQPVPLYVRPPDVTLPT